MTTTSKTQVEILEDYIFMVVGLWNNMVSSATETFLLNLVQTPGSSPAQARLSVAKRQGKEEYKNYPMNAILSCAGRLLLNNAKCPTSKTNLTLLILSTKNFLERFSK